jgi:hypothetical protein
MTKHPRMESVSEARDVAAVSFRFSNLLKQAKAGGNIVHVSAGEIIKDVDESHPACYVLRSGLVAIECDIQTSTGIQPVVLDIIKAGEPFNALAFLRTERASDDGHFRYIAREETDFIFLLSDQLRAKKDEPTIGLLLHMLGALAAKKIELLNAKLELHKMILDDKRHREHEAKLKREIQRIENEYAVKLETATEEIERKWKPPSNPPVSTDVVAEINLHNRIEELTDELAEARKQLAEKDATIARLRRELAPKAHEAFNRLEEDERETRAIGTLMNFFMRLLNRELTDAEIEESRDLIKAVHTRRVDDGILECHPSLTGELLGDLDLHTSFHGDRLTPVVDTPRSVEVPVVPTMRRGTTLPSLTKPPTPSVLSMSALSRLSMEKSPRPSASVIRAKGTASSKPPPAVTVSDQYVPPPSKVPATQQEPAVARTALQPPHPQSSSSRREPIEPVPHTIPGVEPNTRDFPPQPFNPSMTPRERKAERPGAYLLLDVEDEETQIGLGPYKRHTDTPPLERQTLDYMDIQRLQQQMDPTKKS